MMNKFPTNDSKQTFSKTEEAILKFWEENEIFKQSIDSRHPNNEYVFFDGPPFATGLPHYGHILAGTIKDAIPRYMTMKGYRVNRKFGWDCHGVPVEFLIEKEHKIGGKPGIEKMGTGKFNDLCQNAVMRCADDWRSSVARMGRFVDFENDYKTMDPEYMESVWSVFKELWDKNLIYEGEKVIAYSPKLGSPLSNFEAGQNYKDIDDPAVTVEFKLEDFDDQYFLAWTTTPWTLVSNVAVGFGRDTEYSLVDAGAKKYWVATAAIERNFKEALPILETKLGKEFLDTAYEPLFPYFKDESQKRFIALHDNADYVSTDAGTGIVHFAPSFGEEDAALCQKFKVFGVNPINESGYFDETIPELEGKYFRPDPEVDGSKDDNANIWVLDQLKNARRLFKREQIRHSYPHCWRTDCALMYRGIKTWFVDVQAVKDQMIAQNKKINWIPDHLRDGRFGKILETAPDWAISRNRYWGAPIPAWRCTNEDCKHIEVISTREELEAKTGNKVDDIHKQYVDDLHWGCEKCGHKTERIPEVLDCWFESGAMPYASRGIHFQKNKAEANAMNLDQNSAEKLEIKQADFIAEGLDQTRGWFYTLHVLGCALTGKNIYKNVITNGIVLAEDGHKMSKSKKNYPDPNLVFDKYGADAMRYYLLSSPAVRGENLRFMEKGVEEVLKTLLIPIKNAYQFFSLYANIDNWSPTKLTTIRHGEGDHNVQNIYSGDVNNKHHLTATGQDQVKEQAVKIADFDVLMTSPFLRTQETAEIVKSTKNYTGDIIVEDLIRESGFGDLEGKKLIDHTGRLDNSTSESIESIFGRWEKFVDKLLKDFRGQHVCAATHGDGLRGLNGVLGNIPAEKFEFLLIPMPKTAGFQSFILPPQTTNELDLWILSELQTLIEKFRENFDHYNLEVALREIPNFVDNLNNWYLRRNRKRFWQTGLNDDKRSGYETLHHVLLNLAKLLAPVCPFFAEKLFQDLMNDATASVHLTMMPFADQSQINPPLEQKVKNSREIVQLSAAIRARQKIKLRQPLAKLKFITTQKIDLDLDIIAQEANVENVEVLTSIEGIADQIIKVDARKVGRKFGKKTQELIKAGKAGDFKIQDSGQVHLCDEVLEADEYEIGFNTQEGIEAEATRDVVVLLETEISPELEIKGFVREIIRAIQETRKKSGFKVEDRIKINYSTESELLNKAFDQFSENIAKEVLAEKIEKSDELETDEINLEGEKIQLVLEKV